MTDHHPPEMPDMPFYSRAQLTPILFLAAIFFLTFIARVILSPLMPSVESDLRLSHSQAGSLFLCISIGYFIALTGSGFVSARVSHRSTVVVSVIMVGVSLCAIAWCRSYLQLSAAVILLGLSAGIYLPSGIASLTSMTHPRNWGKALALHEIAPNMAYMAAPLVSEILLAFMPWRHIMAIIGMVSIAMGLLFARFGRGGEFLGKPPHFLFFKQLAARKAFWIMVALFGLAISANMGIYSMLPLFLVEDIGMSRRTANLIIAFSRATGLLTALAGGLATDRFGAKRTIGYAFLLSGAATILLGAANSDSFAVLMVFLQAFLSTLFFPAGFTALSSIVPAEMRNIAVSFTVPLAFMFGGGMIPALIGMMGDAGRFSAGVGVTGVLILSGAAMAIYLNLEEKKQTIIGGKED